MICVGLQNEKFLNSKGRVIRNRIYFALTQETDCELLKEVVQGGEGPLNPKWMEGALKNVVWDHLCKVASAIMTPLAKNHGADLPSSFFHTLPNE